jgi:putative DNA methylase
MVDDPSAVPEEFPTEEDQENERLRLFALISELVQWENTTNEQVLNRAREEIRRSWRRCYADNADHPEAAEVFNPEKLPGFHDPFAGGGSLPLEAQRLGLEAYAIDLNPVAVLMKIARIEAQSSKGASGKLFSIGYRGRRGRICLMDCNSHQFKASLVP